MIDRYNAATVGVRYSPPQRRVSSRSPAPYLLHDLTKACKRMKVKRCILTQVRGNITKQLIMTTRRPDSSMHDIPQFAYWGYSFIPFYFKISFTRVFVELTAVCVTTRVYICYICYNYSSKCYFLYRSNSSLAHDEFFYKTCNIISL